MERNLLNPLNPLNPLNLWNPWNPWNAPPYTNISVILIAAALAA